MSASGLPLPVSPLTDLLDSLPGYRRLTGSRYFTTLASGAMSRQEFIHSQRQFYFAVRFFSRPMAALMARLPVSALRQGLIHNLAEEHGFGDGDGDEDGDGGPLPAGRASGFDPAVAHDLTMLRFLETLGVTAESMADGREEPAVRAFNLALLGACLMERTEFAFAALGAIEYAFAEISSQIGKLTVAHGWIAAGSLVHYRLHAEIDKRHAADFLRPLEPGWKAGGEYRQAVEDGLAFGLHLFHQLYRNLAEDAAGLSEKPPFPAFL